MSIPVPRGELPGGGAAAAAMGVAEYIDFLEREYLATYVARGGSAVKLLVTDSDEVAADLAARLDRAGDGFLHANLDAAGTRIHMIDKVFAAIASQIDWLSLAQRVVRKAYDTAGFPAPDKDDEVSGPPLAIDTVAAYHEIDGTELYRRVLRKLQPMVLGDTTLSHEFRVAMLRLCQEPLDHDDVDPTERDTVLGWLRGEKLPAAELRKVSLSGRVARHNARPLLVSLTRWIRRGGLPGLVLRLDLGRVGVARRPPAALREGTYYSKAAALDAYEVLRQLIDSTDELAGLFVAVLLPPELVTDEARGLPAYSALQLRVSDEVRDRRRPNPYATLVRLDARQEAVW